jgi:hypothetical protein
MTKNGGPIIKVILYGIGAIGSEVAKFALTRSGLKIVGAVDSDPAKIGTDLGAVLGFDRPLGIEVSGDPVSVMWSCLLLVLFYLLFMTNWRRSPRLDSTR